VLKVYNTLSKKLEEFKPLEDNLVKIYVCGPTVYDYTHIGHARTYISFDVIVRYLKYKGYNVKYVVNITDIDDKIIRRARELGISPQELARKFEKEFFEDMEALGLLKADYYPRVTDHIEDIIKVVEKLIEKGYAYVVNGNVYYDVTKFPDYGKLSGQTLDQIKAGARIEPDLNKKHPADFALWKKAKEGEPYWNSPWGPGRPGWHIECTVMSMKYLGEQIDIHGGGTDLIFPHHENEIAQSEAYSGKKPFVKYWLHTGYLMIKGEKMSKSLGNIIPVKDFLSKYEPDVLRLLVLSAHYRSPINFTWEKAEQAKSSLERIKRTIERLRRIMTYEKLHIENLSLDEKEVYERVCELRRKFEEAMDEDFNTPKALAEIFEFISYINRKINENKVPGPLARYVHDVLMELLNVFGLLQKFEITGVSAEVKPFIELLVKIRDKARKRKDWETADYIRDELRKLGVILEDTPKGTIWRLSK